MSDKLTWAQVGHALSEVAGDRGEWAGIPVPLPDLPLELEPRYPLQLRIPTPSSSDGLLHVDSVDTVDETVYHRNTFWSDRLRAEVNIYGDSRGIVHFLTPLNSTDPMLNTIGASSAWSLDMEFKALCKLAGLVKEHTLNHYMLTGTFLETSARSKVIYLFRKLRPTVAMSIATGSVRVLCTLCLHPVGYYRNSWAGAMTPTDDVIAHLCLMRGSEEKFWANANQHHPSHPLSGL